MDQPTNEVKPAGESSTPAENVSSPEVKPVASEVNNAAQPVDVNKDKGQIENLNIALKQERESRRISDEKIAHLESQLQESSQVIDKFKSLFSNKEESQEENPQYMTQEQIDEYVEKKFEEKSKKEVEQKQAEFIKQEVQQLEKEYDGKDGKPKYNDEEVLSWQKVNNKLYLSPREAFLAKEKDAIIDWEVKQRLAGRKPANDVEKPGGTEIVHSPQENIPKTESEVRSAILEAMNNAEKGI